MSLINTVIDQFGKLLNNRGYHLSVVQYVINLVFNNRATTFCDMDASLRFRCLRCWCCTL